MMNTLCCQILCFSSLFLFQLKHLIHTNSNLWAHSMSLPRNALSKGAFWRSEAEMVSLFASISQSYMGKQTILRFYDLNASFHAISTDIREFTDMCVDINTNDDEQLLFVFQFFSCLWFSQFSAGGKFAPK